MFHTRTLEIHPGAGFTVQNITHLVSGFLRETNVQQGHLIAFYKHTTGSIFIGEYESGIIADLERAVEAIAPTDGTYHHHLREVDFNGYAHIRAAFMPSSVIIPVQDGELVLGTHQEIQIVDNQPDSLPRFIFLQISGE